MMNRRAESNKAVHGSASDAVESTNQKILEALRIKSPTVEKVGREEEEDEEFEAEETESKTAVSPAQHEPKQEVRKEEEVEDLEEWLDEFLQ